MTITAIKMLLAEQDVESVAAMLSDSDAKALVDSVNLGRSKGLPFDAKIIELVDYLSK